MPYRDRIISFERFITLNNLVLCILLGVRSRCWKWGISCFYSALTHQWNVTEGCQAWEFQYILVEMRTKGIHRGGRIQGVHYPNGMWRRDAMHWEFQYFLPLYKTIINNSSAVLCYILASMRIKDHIERFQKTKKQHISFKRKLVFFPTSFGLHLGVSLYILYNWLYLNLVL